MLADVTIGQYFPGDSLLHRMDPRVKLVLTLAFIILVFVPKSWAGLLLAVAFLIAAVVLSRLPLRLVLKSMKPIVPIVVLTSLINMFYIPGDEIFSLGFLHVTRQGVFTAVFIAVRLLCLIAGSSLLTYTTSPTTLTDALERLLHPLTYLRLNVHELAMMMTIALRFIPTLIEETDKIMSAQKARGADLESGGLMQRVRALIPILIPLFISSFRRAIDLATAMECRCYHGGEGRTRMKQMHMAARDGIALAVTAAVFAGIIVLNRFTPAVI
mgnify:FL=1